MGGTDAVCRIFCCFFFGVKFDIDCGFGRVFGCEVSRGFVWFLSHFPVALALEWKGLVAGFLISFRLGSEEEDDHLAFTMQVRLPVQIMALTLEEQGEQKWFIPRLGASVTHN